MKKALALILSLVMVLALVPAAFAADSATAMTAAPADGDKVVIYYPSGSTVIGSTGTTYTNSSGNTFLQLTPVAATVADGALTVPEGAAVLDVTTAVVDGVTQYTFTCDGKYLTAGETGNNLSFEAAASNYSTWILEAATDGYYIKSVNAAYNNNAQYIEFYTNFTTYGFNSSKANIYTFKFFEIAAAPVVTDTPAPVVTDTPAPVVTDTPAPVVTDTPAPVVTDTPAPVVTDTPEPVVTDTPEPSEKPVYDLTLVIDDAYTDDLIETIGGIDYIKVDVKLTGIKADELLSSAQVEINWDTTKLTYAANSQDMGTVSTYYNTTNPITQVVTSTDKAWTVNASTVWTNAGKTRWAFASDYGCFVRDGIAFSLYFKLADGVQAGEVIPVLSNEVVTNDWAGTEITVCKNDEVQTAVPKTERSYGCDFGALTVGAAPIPPVSNFVIVFTNDVHCDINASSTTFGYADVAAYEKALVAAGNKVILADAGDHVQGGLMGAMSKGEYIIDIMNYMGYDVAVPGNHEFDYGMDRFFELVDMADYPYISANFMNYDNGVATTPVLDAYKMFEHQGVKYAVVGLSTPESITKSTPVYFQNAAGQYIYGFCQDTTGAGLVKAAQDAIDAAKAAGADYVVAVGHLGVDGASSPWMSTEIIPKLSGLSAFIDGHSHTQVEGQIVKDKDGKDVLLGQTGTKLATFGVLTFAEDGITMKLIKKGDFTETDAATQAYIDGLQAEYQEAISKVVAHTDYLLTTKLTDGSRAVRKYETNLGDLCADAYRVIMGADIGFVNGGGIRADIAVGDITLGDVITVHPFSNQACVVEVTGQQILDALEWASRGTEVEEIGGFLQVSGLTYEIHTYIAANVTKDASGVWAGAASATAKYRVQNVKVGGVALDLTKTYTLASHDYMLLNQGDGMGMFGRANVKVLTEPAMLDNQVLINYFYTMPTTTEGDTTIHNVPAEYADPAGQGRIVLVRTYDTSALEAAIEYAEDFMYQEDANGNVVVDAAGNPVPTETFAGLSAGLQAQWVAELANAQALLAAAQAAEPGQIINVDKIDAEITTIYNLAKTGEANSYIVVFAGIAILAILGLALVLRRRYN